MTWASPLMTVTNVGDCSNHWGVRGWRVSGALFSDGGGDDGEELGPEAGAPEVKDEALDEPA